MAEPFKNIVLITGVGGFTGVHLEELMIKKGYEVYGTTSSAPLKKNHFQCNVLDKKELHKILMTIKPNYVVHLAAISYVASKNVQDIYATNIIGTINLLECIEELNLDIKKVLLASSAAVYGNIDGELSEDMCPKPVNHYGNSKLVMENMSKNYFDKFEIIIARPFNYTGVGQNNKFLIPKIVEHYKNKLDIIRLGNLHTYREYNNVQDVSLIYIRLLESSFNSDVVNVCSNNTCSINNILDIATKLTNHKIKVEVNPLFVRKNEIVELKGSTKKLFQVLGSPVSFIGIKQTLYNMLSN